MRKSLYVRIQNDLQALTLEQIIANYDKALNEQDTFGQRWLILIETNAPDYLIEQALEKMNIALNDMDYWESVRRAKVKNMIDLGILPQIY